MLAAPYHLRRERDIVRVYSKGRRIRRADMTITALASRQEQPRYAVVVSKKVSKRATVRNTCRRRVFAAIRSVGETVPGSYDIVVSVHHDVSATDYARLVEQLSGAFGQLGRPGPVTHSDRN